MNSMSEDNRRPPELGGDFPEVEMPFDGTMEDEILAIVIKALNAQGYPGLDSSSLRADPVHRDAAVDMLRDCRPLPVIRDLIDKLQRGQI